MVGEILRKRREELGKDIREISETLKIKYDYLKAIEDEAIEKLPEEVYVKGYIREYAELLHIDPETAINAYIQQISPSKEEKKEVLEKEITHEKKLKIKYLLISLLLILSAATISFILFPTSKEKPNTSTLPVETKPEIPPPPVETKPETPIPAIETKPEIPLSPPHVLEVFATDPTWLAITTDETDPKEILMKPGESVKLKAKNGFSLKIGNAGGVKLIFDGKEFGRLGEKGQVIRINFPNAQT